MYMYVHNNITQYSLLVNIIYKAYIYMYNTHIYNFCISYRYTHKYMNNKYMYTIVNFKYKIPILTIDDTMNILSIQLKL